jgi:DNA-binding NtrC family response regulator
MYPLCVVALMSAQPRPLEGRKILIVEDEAPIALSLASAVAQAGGFAVGPAATVAASFALMADHTLDGALLDIRLRGETSFPLADVLVVLGIPFVFVSGLSSALMPYPHRDRPLFDKPYEVHDVIATLARLLQPVATPASPTSGATPRGGLR